MHTIRDTPRNPSGMLERTLSAESCYFSLGLCALSHANDTALIAYPGSIQVCAYFLLPTLCTLFLLLTLFHLFALSLSLSLSLLLQTGEVQVFDAMNLVSVCL